MKNEIWKNIKGYNNYYSASNLGRVKSKKRYIEQHSKFGNTFMRYIPEKYLSLKDIRGYKNVGLSLNGKVKTEQLHRLILKTFYPCDNMDNLQVNHIDGSKENNNLENLEWVSASENMKHAHKMGLISQKGTKNPSNKLTEQDVLDIRNKYKDLSETNVAKIFNVTRSNVGCIRRRETWRHI